MSGCGFLRGVSLTLALLGALVACTHARPNESREGATPYSAAPQPTADPYHPPPRDTVDVASYRGWQQYSLQCARCHGEDGQGTSFAPSLVRALKPDGDVPTREKFVEILTMGRQDKGMPPAATIGVDASYFDGLYSYLKGRSDGRLHGGRPARKEP